MFFFPIDPYFLFWMQTESPSWKSSGEKYSSLLSWREEGNSCDAT